MKNLIIIILLLISGYFTYQSVFDDNRAAGEVEFDEIQVDDETIESENPDNTSAPVTDTISSDLKPTRLSGLTINQQKIDIELAPLQVKELRAAVKTQLESLYKEIKSFYYDKGRYTSDLTMIGFNFKDKENVKYKFGFLNQFFPDGDLFEVKSIQEDPRQNSSDDIIRFSNGKLVAEKSINGLSLRSYAQYCKKSCEVKKYSYELLLVYPLDKNAKKVDVWTLNNRKDVALVFDGLKE